MRLMHLHGYNCVNVPDSTATPYCKWLPLRLSIREIQNKKQAGLDYRYRWDLTEVPDANNARQFHIRLHTNKLSPILRRQRCFVRSNRTPSLPIQMHPADLHPIAPTVDNSIR